MDLILLRRILFVGVEHSDVVREEGLDMLHGEHQSVVGQVSVDLHEAHKEKPSGGVEDVFGVVEKKLLVPLRVRVIFDNYRLL